MSKKDITRDVILLQEITSSHKDVYELCIPEWSTIIHDVTYKNNTLAFSSHNIESSVFGMRDFYEKYEHGGSSYERKSLKPSDKSLDSLKNYDWDGIHFIK